VRAGRGRVCCRRHQRWPAGRLPVARHLCESIDLPSYQKMESRYNFPAQICKNLATSPSYELHPISAEKRNPSLRKEQVPRFSVHLPPVLLRPEREWLSRSRCAAGAVTDEERRLLAVGLAIERRCSGGCVAEALLRRAPMWPPALASATAASRRHSSICRACISACEPLNDRGSTTDGQCSAVH
jgi:hypothetical protein